MSFSPESRPDRSGSSCPQFQVLCLCQINQARKVLGKICSKFRVSGRVFSGQLCVSHCNVQMKETSRSNDMTFHGALTTSKLLCLLDAIWLVAVGEIVAGKTISAVITHFGTRGLAAVSATEAAMAAAVAAAAAAAGEEEEAAVVVVVVVVEEGAAAVTGEEEEEGAVVAESMQDIKY
ncbi:hypothetical protein BSKO_02612 [Bryopsis sp. KO-2023]|nr:hypothetical protein BSKO_02612 [Bryopsis sp. KO-2023]